MARLNNGKLNVYLKTQSPASGPPTHSCSRTLAAIVVAAALAVYVDANRSAIRLTTKLGWRDVKMQFRPGVAHGVHRLNPVDSYYVMPFQAYPPTPNGFGERARQAELWMKAVQF